MPARDTTASADRVQRSVYQSMGPVRRLQAALEMSQEMRDALAAGICARHPELGKAELRGELLRLLYGPRLAAAVLAASPTLE